MASGGLDYHDPKTHEWYDTVMAVYEYETPSGTVRAYYQTQTTNGSQGYFENFMGDQGTLVISESEANNPGSLYRDPQRPRVGRVGPEGLRLGAEAAGGEGEGRAGACWTSASPCHPTCTGCRSSCATPTTSRTSRTSSTPSGAKPTLNCPAEVGYESAVTVLKVNEAIDAKQRVSFRPEDFKV